MKVVYARKIVRAQPEDETGKGLGATESKPKTKTLSKADKARRQAKEEETSRYVFQPTTSSYHCTDATTANGMTMRTRKTKRKAAHAVLVGIAW